MISDWKKAMADKDTRILKLYTEYANAAHHRTRGSSMDASAFWDLAQRYPGIVSYFNQFLSSVHRFDARIQHSGSLVNGHTLYFGEGQLPTGQRIRFRQMTHLDSARFSISELQFSTVEAFASEMFISLITSLWRTLITPNYCRRAVMVAATMEHGIVLDVDSDIADRVEYESLNVLKKGSEALACTGLALAVTVSRGMK